MNATQGDSQTMDLVWQKCSNALRSELGDSEFALWINPLKTAQASSEERLVLVAPNDRFAKHVRDNHIQRIVDYLKFATQGKVKDAEVRVDQADMAQAKAAANKKVTKPKLSPSFTFNEFVVGVSNQLAYQTCLEVLNRPGASSHNPLFLYGPTGLGKTHLMHALGHSMAEQGKQVLYLTSEQFLNQYISAIRQDTIDTFKQTTRRVDLLLVDDIHMLAQKKKTSLEFLSLFNDLISEGKQLVLASDRYPSSMSEFDDRLLSRFSWGLSVGVEPPELETRMQILSKKAQAQGAHLPHECCDFIAKHVIANVRELEGALNKVLAVARFKNAEVDLALVQAALKDIVSMRAQNISMANIQKVVCEHFGISPKDLVGKKRTRAIARPRQIAMSLSRELTKESFPEIGRAFGGRDHSTVMHAVEQVKKLRDSEVLVERDYQSILRTLER